MKSLIYVRNAGGYLVSLFFLWSINCFFPSTLTTVYAHDCESSASFFVRQSNADIITIPSGNPILLFSYKIPFFILLILLVVLTAATLIFWRKNRHHKRRLQKLQEDTLRQTLAIRAANIGLWDWDLIGNTVYYSREWKRQIGYAENEIGEDFEEWRSRVHPDDIKHTLEQVNKCITEKWEEHKLEFRFRHKDGSYLWILAQASVIPGKNGQPARMRGCHIDITELKYTENALRESEQQFRALVETSPMSILLLRNGKYIYGNPSGVRLLGYEDSADIVGKDALSNIAPEFHKVLKDRIARIQSGRDNSPMELKIVRPDGSFCWTISTSVSVQMDEQPTAIIVGQDVTEFKKTQERLHESEQTLRSIFNASPLAIVLLDREGRVLVSNEEHARRLKVTRDQLIGKRVWDYLPDNVRTTRKEQLKKVFHSGEPFSGEDERQGVWNKYYIHPAVQSLNGQTEAVIVEALDVTQQKNIENRLRDSETKYRRLIQTIPYGIEEVDLEGRIVFFNDAFYRILGYEVEELIGSYIWAREPSPELVTKLKSYFEYIKKEGSRELKAPKQGCS